MRRNTVTSLAIKNILFLKKFTKNGNINTSSTSNTKKIIAIKKNRKVNGSRALNCGENPHSNGLIFSRTNTTFFLSPSPAKTTTATRTKTRPIKDRYIKIN